MVSSGACPRIASAYRAIVELRAPRERGFPWRRLPHRAGVSGRLTSVWAKVHPSTCFPSPRRAGLVASSLPSCRIPRSYPIAPRTVHPIGCCSYLRSLPYGEGRRSDERAWETREKLSNPVLPTVISPFGTAMCSPIFACTENYLLCELISWLYKLRIY